MHIPKRITTLVYVNSSKTSKMDLQNMQNQSMHLVLSSDAKPRLKWTPELHQRFLDAVNQLGGAEKATPKSLMRVMGIPGLTLYHLKSHLQKYRLGKSPQSEALYDDKHEDYVEAQSSDGHCSRETTVGTQSRMTDQQIAQALQLQMEVQRKLYEQIEVQRHLQLRIEAEGKYLQSVLVKAQEALGGYNPSAAGIEHAKAELSQLVSIINNGCPSSPISELTETGVISLKDGGERKQSRGTMCSLESSLTSSESSETKEEEPQKSNRTSVELQLMTVHPEDDKELNADSKNQACGRKRSGTTDSDGYCVDQPITKRCGNQSRKLESSELLDLNSQYHSDTDSDSKTIDLNCSSTNSFSYLEP
ncbi:myb family transcription factor PHL8-like isoform X1 [Prosopis cineraria]|uniref:myb family transcription factor PHL8-like isoform X1 n=1 Tax=Prosopis cineraria TaxID=364024 RepID=UPI0024103554|nr:myb family transcription factor PHL8-like isoform X1 [Prosopis cineraria]